MSNPIIELIELNNDSMKKTDYDSNNDGIVDESSNSSLLDGKDSTEFANLNGDNGVDFKVPLSPAGNDSAASKKYVDDNAGGSGEMNVQSNWNETNSSDDSFIKNKPTIPSVGNGTVTITAGSGLSGGDNFSLNQTANKNISISHSTGSGNNHIPSGGSAGQILKWSANGTALWAAESVGGDMIKATYDTNNNGIVDNSEKLGNQLPSYYATASNLNDYLPLAGGTMSGRLTLDNGDVNSIQVKSNGTSSLIVGYTLDASNHMSFMARTGVSDGPGVSISSGDSTGNYSSVDALGASNTGKHAIKFRHDLTSIDVDDSMQLNHPSTCKAFIFGSPGGTIVSSYNISAITEINSGAIYAYDLTLNFDVTIVNHNPVLSAWAVGLGGGDTLVGMVTGNSGIANGTTNIVRVAFTSADGSYAVQVSNLSVGFFSELDI